MTNNKEAIKNSKVSATVYHPKFYRLNNDVDRGDFNQLLETVYPEIHDEIDGQLRELVKILHPKIKIKEDEYPALVERHLKGCNQHEYGVWVYYPWSNKLVHLLDEEEFIEVRTNRNRYKLTDEEQNYLRSKKIGIIGLSVGQSIALTMAMERVCGELRLADFDTVELSNLNRIRTGLHNLGLHKTVLAAREIMEIDPYLKVKIYSDGITGENIDDFFSCAGTIDLLVEVCDGLDIKIRSRFKARELRIPVLMDTNDRGMLDVERFDLEPDRPILHGLAGDLNPDIIKNLTNEQKIPYILKMVGADTISTRLKASMMEVEQSINTWPQLASSVVLGGALTTDTARRILLDQFHESGRFYIDFDELIADKRPESDYKADYELNCPDELTQEGVQAIAAKYTTNTDSVSIGRDKLVQIVQAACAAPSGGNAQPWKLLYQDNRLYIFHDIYFSYSLLDFNHLGSYVGFGAMLENISIKAAELNLAVKEDIFPLADDNRLVAVISFEEGQPASVMQHLAPTIPLRVTNRELAERVLLNEADKQVLKDIAATVPGSELFIYETEEEINSFAHVLTNTERMRMLNPRGHYDTFVRELRFTRDAVLQTGDGLDVDTLNMSNSDKAAMQIASDPGAIRFLYELEKGEGFRKISEKPIKSASCLCVLAMDGDSSLHFLKAGRAIERIWLEANSRSIAFQPITQITFMLQRYQKNGKADFSDFEMQEFATIERQFNNLLQLPSGKCPAFVFRLFYGGEPPYRSLRRPLEKVLYMP